MKNYKKSLRPLGHLWLAFGAAYGHLTARKAVVLLLLCLYLDLIAKAMHL